MTNLSVKLTDKMSLGERRALALALLLYSGEPLTSIAKKVGCHRSAIYQWLNRYKEKGMEGLVAHLGAGAPSKLSRVQKEYVLDSLTQSTPEKHNISSGLWSVSSVQELVLKSTGVELSRVSVWRLIKKFGITFSQSIQCNTRDFKVQKVTDLWLKESYPSILKHARKAGATVYFVNIYNVRFNYKTSREPNIKLNKIGGYTLNMYTAVSCKGEIRFVINRGSITASKIINFFERLLSCSAKVLIITDYYSWFNSKKMNKFIVSTQERLKVMAPPRSG